MRNPITWGGQAVFATVTIAARTFAACLAHIGFARPTARLARRDQGLKTCPFASLGIRPPTCA